jgi:putative oxidoreductase
VTGLLADPGFCLSQAVGLDHALFAPCGNRLLSWRTARSALSIAFRHIRHLVAVHASPVAHCRDDRPQTLAQRRGAAIFLLSGFGKIAQPEMTQGYIASAGLPFPFLAYLIAIAVELGGGALLVVGFQTRIVALVMAVFTVAAALGFHHDLADQNQMVHFLKNIAITGGFL